MVLSTGGTGLTGRDVTVEAHRDVYEKEIEAFGTVFTMVSLTRRSAPRRCSRAPPGAWRTGRTCSRCPARPVPARTPGTKFWRRQLDYLAHMPCNFVEILPRLDEHLATEMTRLQP